MLRLFKNKITRHMKNWFVYSKHSKISRPSVQKNQTVFENARTFFEENKDITYHVEYGDCIESTKKHKWVGACFDYERVIMIPNDEQGFGIYKNGVMETAGEFTEKLFKWTGGCIWDGKVYGFPRSCNSFACYDLNTDIASCIELDTLYTKEHHYAGLVTDEGVVYQPPRNTDHFLVTDLKTMKTIKLPLIHNLKKACFRYCGGIFHPNGYMYFFPESEGKVIKLNPETNEMTFIGSIISTMVFDAKVVADGNIYGFSAYRPGILKIDILRESTKMIHEDIQSGAYGTKYGVNGKLYSIPGDGSYVWEFDPITDTCNRIFKFSDSMPAKYAGGVVKKDGIIICAPAEANVSMSIIPSRRVKIPDDVYKSFINDCY